MNRYLTIAAAVAVTGVLGWVSVAAQAGAPAAFAKVAPASGTTSIGLAPTLSWTASSGAAYEYCLDTTNDNVCTNWIAAGVENSATPKSLAAGTTYYWQVRASNVSGVTYADNSPTAFWSFSTPASPPEAFSTESPANGAMVQSASPILSWSTAVGATGYEYCYDTTNDNACSTWIGTGTNRSVVLNGLSAGTTYYWNVRASDAFGTTYANGGVAWSFTTQVAPGTFTKAGPTSGVTGLPSSVTLSWNASAGVTNYEFCYDTSNDNACSSWGAVGTSTSVALFNLSVGRTYYWQVRATDSGGSTYADGSASSYWSFTVGEPGAFGKFGPADGQAGIPVNWSVTWSPSPGATGYEYCYDTTDDGACTNWIATQNESGSLTSLVPNTVYYWQVRAITSFGVTYGDGSPTAFWSFTTAPVLPAAPPCNVLTVNGTTASAAAATTVIPVNGSPASFTIEAWIRPGTPVPTRMYRYQSIVADQGFALSLDEYVAGRLNVALVIHPVDNPSLFAASDPRNVTLDQWHHVVFTYDEGTKQARIGLDGAFGFPFDASNTQFAAAGRTLTVGSFGDILPFNGFIDNVRISSTVRYTSDTYTPEVNLVTDADTLALYQFGQATGATTFPDESGNGHTLTGTGGAQTTSGGRCFDPAAPTVTGIAPNIGPTTGGTVVAITGTQFAPGATVSIGGAPATGVTVNSEVSITATSSAHANGAADVVVTNPDGRSAIVDAAFTYFTAPPAAFGKSGPPSGGVVSTPVTLSWGASVGAFGYDYCIDTTNDNACLVWRNANSSTSAVVVGLGPNTTYYWHVRASNSAGTSYSDGGATSFWSFTTAGPPPLPDFRDFNGDGKPDLVWQHSSGSRYVWFLNGTALASGAYITSPADPTLTIVGVNDFTGDAKPDLLLQNTVDGTVTLHRMDGVDDVASQTIQAAQNTPWKVVATGDFNGDRKPDIVWQSIPGGQVYFWFMSSSGGVAGYAGSGGAFAGGFVREANGVTLAVAQASARIVGAADIDLDGSTDLVWQDQATGALSVWYLNGTIIKWIASILPGAVDLNWKIKAVGDYDGDGMADFIFEHTNGSLYIWFMNGATLSRGAYLTPAAVNPAWQLVGPR